MSTTVDSYLPAHWLLPAGVAMILSPQSRDILAMRSLQCPTRTRTVATADIPAAVTRHMKIVPAKWIDEVLDIALESPLPGRVKPGEEDQPPLPKPEDVAQPDVKH